MTQHRIAWVQKSPTWRLVALGGNELNKPRVRLSSLTDTDINFVEKVNTDLCLLQQSTWAPLPKPLVVDSGAGGIGEPNGKEW